MTTRGRAPSRVRSGLVPVVLASMTAGFLVLLLGLSPNLNPLTVVLGGGLRVEVPDVRNQTQASALIELRGRRLDADTSFAHSVSVERGRVISQVPGGGDQTTRNDTVGIVVSLGPSQITVPDATGQTQEAATAALELAGVLVRSVTVNDTAVAKGSVITQSPGPTEVVAGGSTVELTVSLGQPSRPVPDVTKLAIEGALFTLGKAGFNLGTVTNLNDPRLPVNTVISTTPGAGEIRDVDALIDVVISNGPADVTVPSVVGSTFADASARIQSAGLIAAQTIEETPSGGAPGTVVSQNPAGGSPIKPGQVITLTVVAG